MKLIKGILFVITLHLMILVCRPANIMQQGNYGPGLKYSKALQDLPEGIPVFAESVSPEDNEDESGFNHTLPLGHTSLNQQAFLFHTYNLIRYEHAIVGDVSCNKRYLTSRRLRL